jgi:hypothetical protein
MEEGKPRRKRAGRDERGQAATKTPEPRRRRASRDDRKESRDEGGQAATKTPEPARYTARRDSSAQSDSAAPSPRQPQTRGESRVQAAFSAPVGALRTRCVRLLGRTGKPDHKGTLHACEAASPPTNGPIRRHPGSSGLRICASAPERARRLPTREAPPAKRRARRRSSSPKANALQAAPMNRLRGMQRRSAKNAGRLPRASRLAFEMRADRRRILTRAVGCARSPADVRARRWMRALAARGTTPRRRGKRLAVWRTSLTSGQCALALRQSEHRIGHAGSPSDELAQRRRARSPSDQPNAKNRRSELTLGRAGSPLNESWRAVESADSPSCAPAPHRSWQLRIGLRRPRAWADGLALG